jgi:alpha-ketoglutarate-dependent taurine dioxygenase
MKNIQRKEIVCHIDMSNCSNSLKEEIDDVWGNYTAYHIFNVDKQDYEQLYEELAEHLGELRVCHSANDKTTKFSKSRDIKHNPSLYHYFASNTRQPLHTDCAYYEESESPDWLMLYCMDVSEFGGMTHLLSVDTLKYILKKYNPDLLEKIKVDVTWEYLGNDGSKVHKKPIFDGKKINWNYYQIKEKLNDSTVMDIRQEFFDFLENFIVAGGIYDFSKKWKPGDCIIFSDQFTLHARDAFLGNDRWLKDHVFFGRKT